MTSYRTPFPNHERQGSWEEPDLIPQRREYDDYHYDHSPTGYSGDSVRPLYDQDEDFLEGERRVYTDYRDGNPDLRKREGSYRHFEREDRKPSLPRDFRRNEESSRELYPESSRESRFLDSLDEYIREQRELTSAVVRRGKELGPRSLLDLEPLIHDDGRSRDYDKGGDYRSRGYPAEERSRDRGYRSRLDDDDDDYHRRDFNDSSRRYERRPRMEEVDYRDNVDPKRHDYHREHARNDPYYQRGARNDHDKRSEDILYGYRDRHRRCTERDFRKQMNEFNSHGRADSPERDRGRSGRGYSYIDKDKCPYPSRLMQDERPTRSGLRGYNDEPQRGTERREPRCKRERRSSREEYPQHLSRRSRGGRRSGSPGIPSKAHSRSSSPTRQSPNLSGRVPTYDKNPKRKMSVYELNGAKRQKCDRRQAKASPKSQKTPSAELITRDQFLSRDVFNSKECSNHEVEDNSTRSKDLGFRDSTSSRNSCGERDLRHELSESRAAASATKSPNFGDSSDYEERLSTASSTRIIDSEPSAMRSIVQVPKKKSHDSHERRTKNKEEVKIYHSSDSVQIKRSITPEPAVKPRAKQVSTPPSAEPLPVTTVTDQPERTSEVLKRKVSICTARAPSPLLDAAETPKVELPADDLRILIMSRRLRQNEETTTSLDENLAEKNEEALMSPQKEQQCQVSSQSQGSTDAMVELSYSDPEGSANEDSAPSTPTGHATRTVVMRRQVILDYSQERSHPRTSRPSLDKEKDKEKKLDKEKESSGSSNVVLEIVSEGTASPPVLTDLPLYKEDDLESLSTVEIVDNSLESLESHAADESQTSEESTKDVISYEVEHSSFGNAIAGGASSSVVYEQKYGYLKQLEEVSNQEILDYDGSSVDKYQEAKENAVGVQEGEHLKEESNGAWTSSSEHFEKEQQAYQELGHFEKESHAVRENPSDHHEDEQQSVSHYDQEYSQEVGHFREESDAVREDSSEYYEEQHIPHYDQGYHQELRCDAEANDMVRENPANEFEEHIPQYKQEYSQELGYDAENTEMARENPSEYYEEQEHTSYYNQEYSQELEHYTEKSDVVRENPSEHFEEDLPFSHYEQEYPEERRHYTQEGDDVGEDPSEHYEVHQPLSHYEQEHSEESGNCKLESDVVMEDPSGAHEEEQHSLSHYEQEYSQDLGHYTDTQESNVIREDPSEVYEEEQHSVPHYGQEYSQDLGHYTDTQESNVIREDPSEVYEEEQHSVPLYGQEYSQDLGHYTYNESDVLRGDPSDHHEEDQPLSHYEQEYHPGTLYYEEEKDHVRENSSEHHEEDQPIPHYKQQLYKELGHLSESDALREGQSEHYGDQATHHFDQQSYLEHEDFQEESGSLRENSFEHHREERQSVSHHEQEYSLELGHHTQESNFIREDPSEAYEEEHHSFPYYRQEYSQTSFEHHKEERQSVSHYEQEYSQELGHYTEEDESNGLRENPPESYEEEQPAGSHYEQGLSQELGQEEYGTDEIRESSSESYEEDQPAVFLYEQEVENSTDRERGSSSETLKEEHHQGNEQNHFQEFEQFAGTSDSVTESFSDLSDQEYQSSHYDEESSQTGDDESFSSEEESYQSTTDEGNYYKVKEDFSKQLENDTSERQYSSYSNTMSEASFSGHKASYSSEYPQVANSYQYKHESAKQVEDYEYDDDVEEDTPEMSNGYDVILALDSFNDDETDDDIKLSANFDFDKSGIFRNDEAARTGDPQGEGENTEVHGFAYQMDERGSYGDKYVIGRHDVKGTTITEMEDEGRAQNNAQKDIGRTEFTHITGKENLNQSDENPADDRIATTIHYEHSKSCDGIRRLDDDPNTGTADFNQSDETIAEDNGGANSYESSFECDKRRIPEDGPSIGAEKFYQTDEQPVKDFAVNKKCQGSGECEILVYDLSSSPCNNGETEAQTDSQHPDLNRSSGSKYDPALPTKDCGSVNGQNSFGQNENDELQEFNHSMDLLNKSSGSEYNPALPTKDYGIVSEQNSYRHDLNEQQETNHSAGLLNKSSGSEYDPALPTKDYGIVNEQNSYRHDHYEMQKAIHSTDLLNKSSGSEYDPALPTKDYGTLNGQKGHADGEDDVQKLNHSLDADMLNRSSTGSEYDSSLRTNDDGIISIQNKCDDNEVMQQSNHSADILNRSAGSGSEYDPAIPTKDYVSSQVNRVSNDIQELCHLDLDKSSSSEYDPHIPTKDRDVTNEEDHQSDNVLQDLRHSDQDLSKSSGSEIGVHVPTKGCDVTHKQQDYRSDDVSEHPEFNKTSDSEVSMNSCSVPNVLELSHPVYSGKSSGSENGHMSTNDCDVTNEQDCQNDDVIEDLRQPVELNKTIGSETDVHIPTNDYDVRNEQDYHTNDFIHELRSSGSETDVHLPTNDYKVRNEQDYHTDDVIHELRSSGSETDVHIPTNDYDVRNEHDYHTDDVIHELRSSGSETDVHIPTNDYDVRNEQDYHTEDVINELSSSGSETDVHISTNDNDVRNEQDYHTDDVIHELRSSGWETDVHIQTNDNDVNHRDVIPDLRSSDLHKIIVPESGVPIPTKDCDVPNEQDHCCEDVTQDLRQPDLNQSVGSEYDPPMQSENCNNMTDFDKIMEDACAGWSGSIAEKAYGHQSPPESDELQVQHEAPDARECIMVMCNSDITAENLEPLYEMVLRKENRVLGAATEIFLPSDIDANHICIFECVDFQLQRVLCPTLISGGQGTKELYHSLPADLNGCQEDLPTAHITSARNQRSVNSALAAPILLEGCVIERRDVLNQGNSIFSPINDEDQVSSQEESSSLNAVEATSQAVAWQEDMPLQSALECESDESENNVGMSHKSCTSRGESREENDDPDLMYIDEVQYFEGEQPIGKSENTGTPESCNRSISAGENMSEDDTCGRERCDSSNDSAREESLYSAKMSFSEVDGNTSQSEMMLKLRQEFKRCSQNDGQQGCDYVFSSSSETSYSGLFDSYDSVLQTQPYDPECASLYQVSLSDVSLEAPSSSSAHALGVAGYQDSHSDLETASHASPRSSLVSKVSLKTQTAISSMRISSKQPSRCDMSLESHSTSAVVPNVHEDSDIKSRKPYDPANCLMDVDTFSELSGMSLDTPSSSAVEYAATEADTTFVGVEDDDSEPYTPEIYSRSSENDSEPYTPVAYSPVLSLSGDESDPELFSCKDIGDASAPYNPESHCPKDIAMSGASGNEADNEVSTGISSPELFSNKKIHLSLGLKKKPSAQKAHLKSYVGYSSLDMESSNDDAWQKNPEAYSPDSFVPLSKSAAARKSSSRKSVRVHSRLKSDDVECRKQQKATTKDKGCSVENKKPHTSQKSLPSSSKKSERSCEKERKTKEEHTMTCSKRKPLKSLVTVPGTNKRGKGDEDREKMAHHTSTKAKKNSGTKDHNSTSVHKKKESVKRRTVSETNEAETAQERSTPPLKKLKLSSQSSKEGRSPESSGTDTAQQNRKRPSARRDREEKFKKPVSPEKCETKRRSSERTKKAGQKKTVGKGSEVRRKGNSDAGSSSIVLDELKSIMKDRHQKSPKSSDGTKLPQSSAATKTTPTKAKETIDEHHLLDEGHELLELALEESINRSKTDKSPSATKRLNLAEKVDKMKRKLSGAEKMYGNKNINVTQGLKPSEQETQAQLTIDLDDPDNKGSGDAAKAMNKESLDTLKANQTFPVRSINDKSESTELAVKCSGEGKDSIDSSVVTGSKRIDKDLGMENRMGVALQEKKNEDENIKADDDRGKLTKADYSFAVNKNVVSSAIEKQEDSKTEIQNVNIEPRPSGFHEHVGTPVEEKVVNSETEKKKIKQDAPASDKENRFSTLANPGSRRSEKTGKFLIADKSSSVITNRKDNEILESIEDTFAEHQHETRKTSDPLDVVKEKKRENEINGCKEVSQVVPGEDTCKASEEVTNVLSAFSDISSSTSQDQSQGNSRRDVCGQDSKMSGGQLPEDKKRKTVITDDEVGEVQIDRLSKDQDGQSIKGGRGNENDEFDQDKDDWSREGQSNMKKQDTEKNEFDQEKNEWSTESNCNATNASRTGMSRNTDNSDKAVTEVRTIDVEMKNEKKTDDQGVNGTPSDAEQEVICGPTLQRKSTNEENKILRDAFCATIERKLIGPYSEQVAVDGGPSNQDVVQSPSTSCITPCIQVQTGANDSSTPGKGSTPKVQAEDYGSPTPSGVRYTQKAQTSADDSSAGTLCTLKDQTGANDCDTSNYSKSKEGGEDAREAIPSTSGSPSKDVVISSGQPMEEGKDMKSEISLEEYIEAQLQHGLILPDISVSNGPPSKALIEAIPSLPPIPFTNPAATPSVSKSSSLSPLKLPSSSSAMKSQKKHSSPSLSSKSEKGPSLQSGTSKETSLASESNCQVPSMREERSERERPRMDIVRSLTAEYERKIIAILQKRVDVEKAYREECTTIVNAVKALARKKKNMERELQEVLQTSLREISQKYVSELQRFVRNETI